VPIERITKKEENDARESYIFTGDFDGDGYAELANYGCDLRNTSKSSTEDIINVYQPSTDMSQTGRIFRVIDGMNNRTDITYSLGTDPKIYSKTGPMSKSISYPLNTCVLPISLVKSVTSTNGVAGTQSLEYSYKELDFQMTGGGVLGFAETSVMNTSTGEKTTTRIKQRQKNRYWLPHDVYVEKLLGGKVAWTLTTYWDMNANNTYLMCDRYALDVDWDENTNIIIKQFDRDEGYLLEHTVESDFDDMEIYKKVTYSGYEKKSGMWLPTVVTKEQKHTDDPTPYSTETRYSYDNNGNILTKTDYYGTDLALETISTYDEYGNCLSSTSKGKGITGVREVTSYNDYDPSGRFVVKSYQEPAAAANTFTYDIWGHVLTESDETEPTNILTTSHTYDKWGRLVSSLAPDGTKTETITGWGNSDEKKYYTLEKKSETPWVLTWYDNVGHEVLQQTFGPKNVLISKATEYNERGQVKKVTKTNGKLCTSETFTYDDLGRIESDKLSSGKEVTYTYGNRSVTTTIAGRSTTKTIDAWGNTVTSVDAAGNEVSFLYNSNGKPSSVTTNGTTVTMEYDEAGNQKKLTDPDAGTTTYEYAADGMLLKQTDAKGIETENIYDKYGRLTRTNVGGSSISTAIRRSYGSSGNEKLRLRMLRLGMQNYIRYTHDKYGRVITEERYIDRKETFYTHYEYDDRNRLSKVTYPGNLEVEYQYDDYGHVTKMKADGKEVYQLTSYNGLSTTTSFRNGISLTRTRDANGYESLAELTKLHLEQYADSAKTPIDGPILDPIIGPNINSIQTNGVTIGGRPSIGGGGSYFEDRFLKVLDCHDVSYDPLTDNLLARKRYGRSVEAFGYDNLDRLTSISTSTATTVTGTGTLTEVMGITYAPNGNILSKTGVGDYTYNSSVKPHAVMSVDNTDGLIPSNALSTSFNIYGMISTIEDEDSDRIMFFSYGPDLQRSSTTMSKNGQDERKTVYVGNYERITEGGITREFYYLDGGVIIIKQDGEFKPYQAFTDNLGSILSVVDENGEKVFDASYDAWGYQTVTLNEIGLHRGYTGHEMLNEFGIINMNGRLYDPVLGRFFSPDNYVQMPDNSQNFNRYSYCLNNPLKYTDPSGELWWLAPIIGAYLGGSAANEEFNPLKWDFGNWRTYAGMAVGGLSAAAGAAIASSGTIMANTMSIAISSFIYSVGTNLYTGGESPVSINFGFCSYDVTNDTFGYLGKKENSVLSNVGYVFGAMANLSDFVALFGGGTNVDLIVEKKDAISHSAITNESENINISVGPYSELGEYINMEALKSINTTFKELSRTMKGKIWENHANDGIGWKLRINNVNKNILVRLSKKLQAKMDNKTLEWNLLGKSCVGYTSKALWSVGIPNLGGIHPYWLQLQMLTRQVGIYSSPYLYQIR
jgi:RHS repeat-associated protein